MRETLRLSEKEVKNSAKKTLEKKNRQSQSKLITSEEKTFVSGEISNEDKLDRREYNKNVISRDSYDWAKARELRADETEKAYVKAYKEYDPRFTKNKDDELIIMTRPPFLAFSAAAKELKRLYGVMVNARANSAHENENKKIQENLATYGEIKFKDSESGLKPVTREAFRRSNEVEERAADIKRRQTDAEIDRFLAKAGERKAR